MKLILINGPSRSGKDTAAHTILNSNDINNPVCFEKFSFPMKHAFAGLMTVGIDDYGNVELYEENKSKPILLLGNASYRDWQIAFAEEFMRLKYGTHIFSKLFIHRISHLQTEVGVAEWVVVVSDCGFQKEVNYIISEFPSEDIAVFRLLRPGYTFEGDSREYVFTDSGSSVFFREILNDGTLEEFQAKVLVNTMEFLNAK